MKAFVVVLFSFTTLLSAAKAQGDEKNYYSRRYDSIDVNTIFRSSRLLNNYVDCLLDKKPCPPEGKDLKTSNNVQSNQLDQLPVRRSPSVGESNDQNTPNQVQTERTRIPSTWITSSTTTTPPPPTTTRAPLRTTPQSMRPPATVRAPPGTSRPVQPTILIDSLFLPRPNGAITKSINKLIDQTEKVVVNVGQLFRSTFEIITGTG